MTILRRHATLATGLSLAVLVLAGGAWVRFVILEPREIAAACKVGLGPWWCGLRQVLVYAFYYNGVGGVSLFCGALSVLVRGWPARVAAVLAIAFGAAGLILYNAGTGAPGMLLGWLRSIRIDHPSVARPQEDKIDLGDEVA